MTYQEAVAQAGLLVLRRDAETLLQCLTGRDRAWLLAHPEAELTGLELDRYLALVLRRAAHEPLQYLTERQEFYGLELRLTPDVLIPRPETELLVEAVLQWAKPGNREPAPGLRVVDVGTGSGAIALALAKHLPTAEITAVDLSRAALAVAAANAERLGIGHLVCFRQSDLLSFLSAAKVGAPTALDIVVSNPPYVPEGDAPGMQPEVRDHEPHLALFAGGDGLAIYRRLIPEAETLLRAGGLLAMEFGFGQRNALAQLLSGWREVRFLDDYAGIPRVVLAERR